MSRLTPFQTVGPFLHLGLRNGLGPMTASGLTTPIIVGGRLLDGAGAGIPDGVLEFWAAGFDGIGRVWTGADGGYRLETRMPMSREESGGTVHAPHFAVRVLARGILTEYLTRAYFDGAPSNERDPILREVPADRRATLIAVATAINDTGPSEYHFDIVVQGDRETVFFDL
ncbi:MAG: protocatechuate 3,4-dioxygenase subunit alpha [Vicinamibacterales bacterium]